MAGLSNQNQLRSVDGFAVTYLWDIYFHGAPYPFDQWFPARLVEEPVFSIYSKDIEYYISRYAIPQGKQRLTMTVSFYDNCDNVLEKWVRDWDKLIFNEGLELTPLEECCKTLDVKRLTRDRALLSEIRYWVVPDSNFRILSNSENSLRGLELSLNVVGMRVLKEPISTKRR
ncbi:MAG: hypothetical protein WC511_02760 [Candidatus Pacearchaeota archaeon]